MRDISAAFSIAALTLALSGCALDGAQGPNTDLASLLPPARDMAISAERRGDWTTAAQNWQSVVQSAPEDREARLSLARALRLTDRCGPATSALTPLLTNVEPDAGALVESAKCALVSGRPEAAEAQLRTALESAPELWEARSALAVTLDRQGRHEEAQVHHDQALILAPGKPIVISNKALSLALAGRLDEGVALMRQAAAIPGAPARVRINLAMLEAMSGSTDRASTILSQELITDKADTMGLVRRIAETSGRAK